MDRFRLPMLEFEPSANKREKSSQYSELRLVYVCIVRCSRIPLLLLYPSFVLYSSWFLHVSYTERKYTMETTVNDSKRKID